MTTLPTNLTKKKGSRKTPYSIKANGHTIQVRHDLTKFPWLRETASGRFRKDGLPDIRYWQKNGAVVVAIELFTDDEGVRGYRLFLDERGKLPSDDAVRPDSIRPGRTSRACLDDPEGWNFRYGCTRYKVDQIV
jgi:hypothetical protein